MSRFSIGSRVGFKTAGRYPAPQRGRIESLDQLSPEKGWAEVKCDDGVMRRIRPKSMVLLD